MIEEATGTVDCPFDFPIFVLEIALDGSPPAYLTAELSAVSIGLFLFTRRELAEQFAVANGIDSVRTASLPSAADAAQAFQVAAENGITDVAIDAVADGRFVTFPIREFAERLAKL